VLVSLSPRRNAEKPAAQPRGAFVLGVFTAKLLPLLLFAIAQPLAKPDFVIHRLEPSPVQVTAKVERVRLALGPRLARGAQIGAKAALASQNARAGDGDEDLAADVLVRSRHWTAVAEEEELEGGLRDAGARQRVSRDGSVVHRAIRNLEGVGIVVEPDEYLHFEGGIDRRQ